MKKSFILFAASLLVLAGCTRNQEIDIQESGLTLFARTESPAETKTIVESGTHVYWEPGDEIAVFTGEKAAKFTTDITAASGTATFKGSLGEEAWPEEIDLWAVYPYSEDAVFAGETITTTLPSEQVAREGSFGKDMNLAIAHSTGTTLQFYNVGGGIRFSVLEEGIKKVMFEGLGGEIISGKVKIGMDENGKPEVKEVTGGSQFITLLPPSGKEAFEKDTWYYIVAIPGALEGGYKLRFYKDSDYARKVSEKKVEIKRSIFGSLEKADSGIEFEAQTTHFPETENEWAKSVELTYSIGDIAGSLIDSLRRDNLLGAKEILQNIEGVLDVWVDPENELIAIMQKDSIVVNYPNPRRFIHEPESLDRSVYSSSSYFSNAVTPSQSSRKTKKHSQSSGITKEKKALILIPCEIPESDYYTNHIDYLRNCLIDIGYDSDNIVSKPGPKAGIEFFYGEELSKYDYIHITTHGDIAYYTYQKEKKDRRKGTCFASATEYDGAWAVGNLASKVIDKDDIALMYCDHVFDNLKTSKYYVAMTAEQLNNASFDNSCVLVSACHSAETVNGIEGGTILPKFIDKGAGIASGYLISANGDYSEPYARLITKLMSHGISFQDADNYIKNANWFDEYLFKNGIEWKRSILQNKKITFADYELYLKEISHDNAIYYPRPEQSPQPYYLHKLNLQLSNDEVFTIENVKLCWDFDFIQFVEEFPYYDYSTSPTEYHVETIPFGVQYEVYINNMPPHVAEDSYYEWVSPTKGDYSWYVVAKIIEGDTVVASYQSETGHFSVKDSPATGDIEGTEENPWN